MNKNELLEVMNNTIAIERKLTKMVYGHTRKKNVVAAINELADLNRNLCIKLLEERPKNEENTILKEIEDLV